MVGQDPIAASLKHPALGDFYRLWSTCRQGGAMPAMSTIHGADLAPWRANLTVIEVKAVDGFRYAFYGRSLREAFGVDMTGADLTQLPPDRGAVLKAEYRTVVQSAAPAWRLYTAQFDGAWQTWERLVLPVADEPVAGQAARVGWLLVAAYRIDHPVSMTT